jgi:tetratricopeptide (TPR) repeat protein
VILFRSVIRVLALAVSLAGLALRPALRAQQASPASSGISVESNRQVFATMCALDAAGFDAESSTFAEMPGRLALRDQMLKVQGPAAEALRAFYRDHVLADPGETLSRYITFALVAGPPPSFKLVGGRDLIPPDALAIEGFQDILANFYAEARLDREWSRVEPEYDRAIARDQAPLRHIVTVTNAYLRELLKPERGRTFTVYVEPLVANRANFRNLGNHYAMVIGTGSFPTEEVQHAYLHFMLDPLPLQYRKSVETKSGLLNVAAKAPRLPVVYQNDFLAFADECLIKAVELRLKRLSPAQLDALLNDMDQSGFVLVRPLVAQLQKFEKAEPAMSYYFPDLMAGVDVDTEQKRLKEVKFADVELAPTAAANDNAAADEASELDTWLAEGDRQIAARDVPGARATFEKITAKYPDDARAVYGLAIAWVLSGTQGSAENAKDLFERLVSKPVSADPDAPKPIQTSDPKIVAWSHVYLGRIHDLEDERDQALGEYHLALAVDGAPEAARVAAQRGIAATYAPPARPGQGEPQKP